MEYACPRASSNKPSSRTEPSPALNAKSEFHSRSEALSPLSSSTASSSVASSSVQQLFQQKEGAPKSKGYKKKKRALVQLIQCLTVGSRSSRAKDEEEAAMPTVLRRFSSSMTAETRRDRSAALAASMICILKKNTAATTTNPHDSYVPAIPPPNSLLLMRGVVANSKKGFSSAAGFDYSPCFQLKMNWAPVELQHHHHHHQLPQKTDDIHVRDDGEANDGELPSTTSRAASIWERRAVGEISAIDTTRLRSS